MRAFIIVSSDECAYSSFGGPDECAHSCERLMIYLRQYGAGVAYVASVAIGGAHVGPARLCSVGARCSWADANGRGVEAEKALWCDWAVARGEVDADGLVFVAEMYGV